MFLVLLLVRRGFRSLEAFVTALLLVIAACFCAQTVLASPSLGGVAAGLVPSARIVRDPAMLYIAIGSVGATVMPHNLYLHSAIIQTRAYRRTAEGRSSALRWAVADSTLALTLALFVNAAILIVAAAVFHDTGRTDALALSRSLTAAAWLATGLIVGLNVKLLADAVF